MFAKKGDKKLSQKGPEMQFFYKPKVRGKRKKNKGSSDHFSKVIWDEKQWQTFTVKPCFTRPSF